MLWIQVLYQIDDLQCFVPVCGSSFFLLVLSFNKQKVLIFMKSAYQFALSWVFRCHI